MVSIGTGALATVDLVISQGSDCSFTFQYLTGTGTGGSPIDLTGWSARAQLRATASGPLWCTLTSGSGGGITLDSAGNVLVTLAHALTAAWGSLDHGVWDLQLTDTAGTVVRLVEGKVTVDHSVTR